MPYGVIFATWYGQASFELSSDDTHILVDPYFSPGADRRYPPMRTPADVRHIDLILATHEHDDHLDVPFILELLDLGSPVRVVVPLPIMEEVRQKGIPGDRLVGAQPGHSLQIGSAVVHPIPAFHGIGLGIEPVRYGFRSSREDDGYRFLGYVVEMNGVKVYHAGDTLVYNGMAERLADFDPDVWMLPINGRSDVREALGIVGNMTAEEAAQLCAAGHTRTVVPMHYEGFDNNLGDVGHFTTLIDRQGMSNVLLMNRGHRVPLVGAIEGYTL